MKSPQSVDKIRKELRRVFRQYMAIRILLNTVSQQEWHRFHESLVRISELNQPKLGEFYSSIRTELDLHIQRYGVVASLEEMEEIIRSTSPKGDFVYVSKSHLQHMFTMYEKAFPRFARLPPHARIAIDTKGIRPNNSTVEYSSLEASLFEDVALLWNHAKLADTQMGAARDDSEKVKMSMALRRAAAKAAFNLIEGYINGIGYDIVLTRKTSDSEQEKLYEWDSRNNKARPLSLRDKILQYPKMATQSNHPPLTEANCDELSRMVEAEKKLRHALIHPTPRVAQRGHGVEFREGIYTEITLDDVASLVDTTTALIYRIQDCIGNMFGEVDYWLFERNESGLFPEHTFS